MVKFHLHLVSDSTGETVRTVARASLVQFQGLEVDEHLWTLVRNRTQVDEVIQAITEKPGFVLYTLVNQEIRAMFEESCRAMGVPHTSPLTPVVGALAEYLGAEALAKPGGQHVMDQDYFDRIDAMHFVLSHDDGQARQNLALADVILLGVSRTSKTPTCMYLANRGIRAANVPIVPGSPLPSEILTATHPLIVGLTTDPKRLVQLRRARMRMMHNDTQSDYVDLEKVAREMNDARRLFADHNWPTIDVSRRSVEETAAAIMQLYERRKEKRA